MPATAVLVAEAGLDIQDFTGRPVVFEGFGTPDEGLRIILYEWDFESDGTYDWNSTRTGVATHRYWEAGEVNATLRVTQYNSISSELLTDTDHTTVRIISGEPVGRITSDGKALVNSQHAIASSFYDPDGGQLLYDWKIEGEFVSDEPTFKHKFTELRDYNVTLFVTDDEGEWVTAQADIRVVEELGEEPNTSIFLWAIVIVLALVVVAVVAYRAILKGHDKDGRRKGPKTYADISGDTPEIVTEASLADRDTEVAPRSKPKVVRPERVAAKPGKAKGGMAVVAAAPDRRPCPECGTTISEDGTCPFCHANEAIDGVEKHLRELQAEGFILAKAEEELERAKTELHVKNFGGVDAGLAEARELMTQAVTEHDRCIALMELNDQLIEMATDRDLDVTKASNLLKLSKSFLKSGKYDKATFYAERSRDFLLDTLEPFDLDMYFCEHCRREVEVDDDECPHCDKPIESGILKRAKRELALLMGRFDGLSRDHEGHEPIAVQLEKANVHVDKRSASAANEHISNARRLLDEVEGVDASKEGPEAGDEDDGNKAEEEDVEEVVDEGEVDADDDPEDVDDAEGPV